MILGESSTQTDRAGMRIHYASTYLQHYLQHSRQARPLKGIVHLNIIFSYIKVNQIYNLDHSVY